MLLRTAGVNHFDPLAKERVQQWLANYAQEQPGPSFIATEWDQGIFERVRGQRNRFRRLAAERWPEFSDELLDILTVSLGYEAESHTLSYPNLGILWLDQGRQMTQDEINEINRYAEGRLALYSEFIGEDLDLENRDQVLTAMSRAADERAAGAAGVGDRDRQFAQRILRRATENGWAIAIVGRRHAADVNGSMRRLLEEGGQRCEVVVL
jgi:hypothetical protein